MSIQNGKRLGFEIKYSEVPKITRSMHSAIEDLNLDRLYLIYRGNRNIRLDEKVFALTAESITDYDFSDDD
jgi:hypothetical protein